MLTSVKSPDTHSGNSSHARKTGKDNQTTPTQTSPVQLDKFFSSLLSPSNNHVGIGVSVTKTSKGSIAVSSIQRGGPAELSGKINHGDVILEIDKKPAGKTLEEVGRQLAGEAGKAVRLKVRREGVFGSEVLEVEIKRGAVSKTGAGPAQDGKRTPQRSPANSSSTRGAEIASPRQDLLGNMITSISDQAAMLLGGREGIGIEVTKTSKGSIAVSSIQRGGPAELSGKINHGDVILEIDKKPAGKTLEEVGRQLAGEAGKAVRLKVRREGVFGSEVLEVEIKRGAVSKTGAGPAVKLENGRGSKEETSRHADVLPSSLVAPSPKSSRSVPREKNLADIVLDHTLGQILDRMECDKIEKVYVEHAN
ncbi:hypothetical protein GUITHDRAFT_101057 [Guillardia theta CCMP2712]|uniref:PDZ domain-containing protein n=2 Tax=Guillardia theta TaxID=55529 RepID=L1JYF4_GUITC|nr:hypothetical protein GUITHDRAFT_101057 [Guillardia theta CCMP2712]EKX53354.1 hypothetical protein GUITHDRAFT_101057 [Guillardia theta CCMP2712]|eukprot:XP_005840334.1 hypothetical protein GUITHDRAFT_101057 [Guillardia theta CCMP2712]